MKNNDEINGKKLPRRGLMRGANTAASDGIVEHMAGLERCSLPRLKFVPNSSKGSPLPVQAAGGFCWLSLGLLPWLKLSDANTENGIFPVAALAVIAGMVSVILLMPGKCLLNCWGKCLLYCYCWKSVCYIDNAYWKNVCYTANDGIVYVILLMLELCLLCCYRWKCVW
jgi:hypothetical protein